VAELVDALVSGASGSNTVLVRVQSRAHSPGPFRPGFFFRGARHIFEVETGHCSSLLFIFALPMEPGQGSQAACPCGEIGRRATLRG
jgi:hypothetical protein